MFQPSLSSPLGFRLVATLIAVVGCVGAADTALAFPSPILVDETATRFPGGLAGPLDYTSQLTIGDLDGDTDLDIVWANGGGSAAAAQLLRIYINDGTAHFTDQTATLTGNAAFVAHGAELGDVERDGDLDIIVAQDFGLQPALLINNGLGTFTNETAARLPLGGFSSSRGQFGDVDNDGDLDIYIVNAGPTSRFGSGRGKLWLNDGTGHFTDVTATNTVNETVAAPLDCIFGDVDGDFDLDIHVGSRSSQSKLYKNNGSGVFTSSPIAGGASAYSYDFGDMDSDGDLDLLGANAGPGFSELLLVNNGSGSFSTGAFTGSSSDDNDSKFFDIDNDGDMDILIASLGSTERVYIDSGPPLFTFSLGSRIITPIGDSSLDVKVADLNGDGRYDVVTGQGESGSFLNRIYMNNTGAVDTRAPTIVRTEQVTSVTSDDGGLYGPFPVRVEIFDAHTSDRGFHDKGVTLNWRLGSEGPFNTVAMDWNGNSLWRGEIPPQKANFSIDYFVTARDFANNLATGPTLNFFYAFSSNCPVNIVNSGTSANTVDVDDLLAVISQWGPCPAPPAACPANIVNVGSSANKVDVDDLLAVISGWGPCAP